MFKAFVQNQPYFRFNITCNTKFSSIFSYFFGQRLSLSLSPPLSLSPDIIYILQKRYIYKIEQNILFLKKGMFNIIFIKELNKLGLTCIFCTRVIYTSK